MVSSWLALLAWALCAVLARADVFAFDNRIGPISSTDWMQTDAYPRIVGFAFTTPPSPGCWQLSALTLTVSAATTPTPMRLKVQLWTTASTNPYQPATLAYQLVSPEAAVQLTLLPQDFTFPLAVAGYPRLNITGGSSYALMLQDNEFPYISQFMRVFRCANASVAPASAIPGMTAAHMWYRSRDGVTDSWQTDDAWACVRVQAVDLGPGCLGPVPEGSPTATATVTGTASVGSATATATDTATGTGTATASSTATGTSSETSTGTGTLTGSTTPTATSTATATATGTSTFSATPGSSSTATGSATVTATATATATATGTATGTAAGTATSSGAATLSSSPSGTPSNTSSDNINRPGQAAPPSAAGGIAGGLVAAALAVLAVYCLSSRSTRAQRLRMYAKQSLRKWEAAALSSSRPSVVTTSVVYTSTMASSSAGPGTAGTPRFLSASAGPGIA